MPCMEWNGKINKWVKECSKCKVEYLGEGSSWEEGRNNIMQFFWPNTTNQYVDELQSSCKECKGHRDNKRISNGKSRTEMLNEQNSKCAICDIEISFVDKTAAVDHNHTTQVIRGILCHKCNQGLGSFKDNPDNLTKAAAYLNLHNKVGSEV